MGGASTAVFEVVRLKEARDIKPMDPSAAGCRRAEDTHQHPKHRRWETEGHSSGGQKKKTTPFSFGLNLHVEVFNPSDPLERKGAAASKRIELGLTLLIHEKKWTRRGGTLVQYDARREGEWADRVCVQQKERTVRCLLWRP